MSADKRYTHLYTHDDCQGCNICNSNKQLEEGFQENAKFGPGGRQFTKSFLEPGNIIIDENTILYIDDYIEIVDDLGVSVRGKYLGYNYEQNLMVLQMPKSFCRESILIKLPFHRNTYSKHLGKYSMKKCKLFNEAQIIGVFNELSEYNRLLLEKQIQLLKDTKEYDYSYDKMFQDIKNINI